MNETEAAELFDSMWADATASLDRTLSLQRIAEALEQAGLTALEREAADHYVAEGEARPLLAERIRALSVQILAAAIVAARRAQVPTPDLHGVLRRRFIDRVLSRLPSLLSRTPPEKARQFIRVMDSTVGIGRSKLAAADLDQVDAHMAVEDLLEGAAMASLLADLVGSPPQPSEDVPADPV